MRSKSKRLGNTPQFAQSGKGTVAWELWIKLGKGTPGVRKHTLSQLQTEALKIKSRKGGRIFRRIICMLSEQRSNRRYRLTHDKWGEKKYYGNWLHGINVYLMITRIMLVNVLIIGFLGGKNKQFVTLANCHGVNTPTTVNSTCQSDTTECEVEKRCKDLTLMNQLHIPLMVTMQNSIAVRVEERKSNHKTDTALLSVKRYQPGNGWKFPSVSVFLSRT